MSEQQQNGERNQGATRHESAAAAAPGQQPATKPEHLRDLDAVPLSEGTVHDGGGYMGGERPGDAQGGSEENRAPLDNREAFGGDGAQYVDPAISKGKILNEAERARSNGTAIGQEGFDAQASTGQNQDR
jgi:hypothetical protein